MPEAGGLGGSRRESVHEEEELPSEPPPEYQRLEGGNSEGVVEGQREIRAVSTGAGNEQENRKRGRSFGKKLFGRKSVNSVEEANNVVR